MHAKIRRKVDENKLRSFFVGASLFAVGFLHSIQLIDRTIVPSWMQLWAIKDQPAILRSAIVLKGQEFADYIDFVRQTVPENAKLILPPHTPVQAYSNMGLMQYFFMPRELHNCGVDEVDECILRMTGPTSYIITAWKFPPRDLALQVKEFLPFKDDKGVYAPIQ